MDKKTIIQLPNRYGSNMFLEKEGDFYYLRGDEDALMAVGVAFDATPDSILAIDPSGGPILSIGSVIEGNVIESITYTEKGFKIKFKDELFQTNKDNLS